MPKGAPGYSLVRFGLNSPDARRLAGFFEDSFSAVILSREYESAHREHTAAWRITLQLGESILDIRQFDEPGAPYPEDLSPYDQRFQHLAIVVADMSLAVQRLSQMSGWTPISTNGPQTLPKSAGGVAAFKFRDPDGHPLEFLEFPRGNAPPHWARASNSTLFPGIDHSAISVGDVDRSIELYRSLGLTQSTRTLNEGPEQQHLDGIRDPHVDVVGLSPRNPTPHVELLHYRTAAPPPSWSLAVNDVAATRLVFSSVSDAPLPRGTLHQDPDGHFFELLN